MEGHHLVYVNALVDAIKSQGHRVTVSLPQNNGATREKLLSHGCRWVDRIEWVPWTGGLGPSMLDASSKIKDACGADEVFFACVDEWASGTLRRAALGLKPAASLRGLLSGIYVRPRPLDPECHPRSLGSWLKQRGWRRLDRDGWFRRIFVLDERLPAQQAKARGKCLVSFMPEPTMEISMPFPSQAEARQQLRIPKKAFVFLHYGLGTRRKGLHHTIEAWRQLPAGQQVLLLMAGQADAEFSAALQELRNAGKAVLLDRYIGKEEEQLVMSASDVVLLPYVNHYGSSNVLNRAAAAGRMVLASDQGLVGYRVRRYGLGALCQHDDAESLRQAVTQLVASDRAAIHDKNSANLKTFTELMSPNKIADLFAHKTGETTAKRAVQH